MKKYYNFAAGWANTTKQGKEYVSCKANEKAENDKGKVRIQAVNEDGVAVDITSFVMMPNPKKEKDNQPDVYFSFTIED